MIPCRIVRTKISEELYMNNLATSSETHAHSQPLVRIGNSRYALIRQFREGALSVVWQAQKIQPYIQDNDKFSRPVSDNDPQKVYRYLLQDSDSKWAIDDGLGTELVAIKLPRDEKARVDLQDEAKNLRSLRKSSQRLVELKEDFSSDEQCPCLILAWARGRQLDTIQEPLSEAEALYMAFQVAEVIEGIFNRQYVALTDSIKPNSIFWDGRQITIIDLGLVGKQLSSLERQTLPILGDTLHKALTGEATSSLDSLNEEGIPTGNRLGKAKKWQDLSYQTRQIVQKLLSSDFRPESDMAPGASEFDTMSQVIGAVRSALEEQVGLWDEPADGLLKKALHEKGTTAINLYDIARLRDANLTDRDEKAYKNKWDAYLWNLLQSARHKEATLDIHWARRHFPKNPLPRRAWLASQAGLEGENWEQLLGALKILEEGDVSFQKEHFQDAAEKYGEAKEYIDSLSLEPLLKEAAFLEARAQAEAILQESRPEEGDLNTAYNYLSTASEELKRFRELQTEDQIGQEWANSVKQLQGSIAEKNGHLRNLLDNLDHKLKERNFERAAELANELLVSFSHEETRVKLGIADAALKLKKLNRIEVEGGTDIALTDITEAAEAVSKVKPEERHTISLEIKAFSKVLERVSRGYAELNDYENAIAYLDKLLQIEPNNSLKDERSPWKSKQEVYKNLQEKWGDALEKRKIALSALLNKKNLAHHFMHLKNWRDAISNLDEALKSAIDEGFDFDEQRRSLHLLQSYVRSERGLHRAARIAAENAVKSCQAMLNAEEKKTIWLSSADREALKSALGAAQEREKKDLDLIGELEKDVLEDILQFDQDAEANLLNRFLLQLALNKRLGRENVVQELSNELPEKIKDKPGEEQVAYLGLAWLVTRNDEVKKRWSEKQEKLQKETEKKRENFKKELQEKIAAEVVDQIEAVLMQPQFQDALKHGEFAWALKLDEELENALKNEPDSTSDDSASVKNYLHEESV